ncbi:hypothetical protein OC842_000930 [Tilletia horrida]|uniref:FAD/NAD(P)-binding domain-containing protein n=1 Tax=Tilletia horrida TaxID=155126 RepID=A0AAN6GFW9_9BASI|nr:hypothetical protein OC842_000930 [Tilletia horrida]
MSADLKNIVVIGASSAGSAAARSLGKSLPSTHRVILIEAAEAAFWPPSSLRAAVVEGWEDKTFAPLDGFFAEGSRHVVRSSTRVIEVSNSDVLVQTPAGTQERIPFEYAILATGSTYPSPSRPVSDKLSEAKAAFKKLQSDIRKAKSILIIGGGEVGVEIAGEIRAVYPGDKKVTLVSRSDRLIGKSTPPALHNKLYPQLISRNVDVLLGDSVDLPKDISSTSLLSEPRSFTSQNGADIPDVDLVIVATGTKPAIDLFAKADPASIVDGQIKVDHKTLRADSSVLTKWFAAGDVAQLPGLKTHVNAKTGGEVAAANIVSLLKGGKGDAKSFSVMNVTAVPLGPKAGAINLFGWVFGEWTISAIKGRSLFVGQFQGTYKP